MKTWKQGIFGFLMVIALAFAFIACDDKSNDPPEQPQFREATITLDFRYFMSNVENGKICTANVQGTLLEAEWSGVADKVETAINEVFPKNPTSAIEAGMRSGFNYVFENNDVIIVVSKTGKSCEVKSDNFRILYLRLDYLDNANLQSTIFDAVNAMGNPFVYELE